jgi:hypothetical protein
MTQQAKTLSKLFLKVELRSKDGSARKLFMLLIAYLLPGLVFPFLIYKQNTDPTGFQFTFLTFLFYSMIMAITSVMEMDNLVISKSERDMLAYFPLRDELIVTAKLYVIRRYAFIISLPLLIPGAFYYFVLLRSVTHAILYLVSGILLTFFVLSLLLLLYSFTFRLLKTERLNNFTLFFQLILILAMVFGYQYISYSLSNRSHATAGAFFGVLESGDILRFFPHSWFAFLAAKGKYIFNYKFTFKLILPFFITYMGWLGLKFYLTDNYSRIYEKFVQSRSISERQNTFSESLRLGKYLDRFYLNNNPLEKSSFALMSYMLGRDKAMRLSIFPMIIIPVGLALFALITDQLPSPFVQYYLVSTPVFHISILVTVFVILNTAILGVKVTNDREAAWAYDAYPINPRKNFINGIRKFFLIYLILPVCLLLFIIF